MNIWKILAASSFFLFLPISYSNGDSYFEEDVKIDVVDINPADLKRKVNDTPESKEIILIASCNDKSCNSD